MRKSFIFGVVCAVAAALVSCVGGPSPREQFDKAIAEGKLSEAQVVLTQMRGESDFNLCCEILIDEYLSIGNLNKAIYVFDKVSSHCSMYEMKFDSLYDEDGFTKRNSQKIYKKLIAADRFDEAWAYHPLSYSSEEYPGNAHDYFSYMVDVITHLCTNQRHDEAYTFITSHIHWFSKNVDNHQWGKDYPEYSKNTMHGQIMDVYNSFQ